VGNDCPNPSSSETLDGLTERWPVQIEPQFA